MDCIIVFQNTHYVIKAEKKLLAKNISVGAMPLPTMLGNHCGICLRLSLEEVLMGINYLKEAKIPFQEIFKIEERNNEKVYKLWNL